MIWKGEELVTIGDVSRAVVNCASPAEARSFMRLYIKECGDEDTARTNVGYLAGYHSSDVMARIFEWFDVEHPITGKRLDASPEELIEAGKRWMLGEFS